MRWAYFLSIILLTVSCGKKQDTLSDDSVEIICKTLRSENPSVCAANPGNATPANEICILGFGEVQVPGRIIPSAIKSNVDNGTIKLINSSTGKKLLFKTVIDSNTNQSYLIVQQEGDTGLTSTVNLPVCPNN